MSVIKERVAMLGARLGNWNDRTFARGDRRSGHPWHWHVIDRVASLLCTWPER